MNATATLWLLRDAASEITEAVRTSARAEFEAASDDARRSQRAFELASELWAECPVPSQRGCRCERCRGER